MNNTSFLIFNQGKLKFENMIFQKLNETKNEKNISPFVIKNADSFDLLFSIIKGNFICRFLYFFLLFKNFI